MLKYSQKLKSPQPMLQQVMFNYIKGGRHEIVEESRYEENEELTQHQKNIEEAKKKLQWRQPFVQQESFWKSKFSVFTSEKADASSADVLELLSTKFDFSWKGMKERRERKRVKMAALMQQFIPQRHEVLGNDLAAAHFICFRRGSVKFTNSNKWFSGNENDVSFDFPNVYDKSYKVEEVKCDNMELYYEGLENIRRLESLKTISFRNVKTFDDWYLDRLSGSNFPALEVLDISGTSISERGLCALYRLPSLKVLIVDDPKKSNSLPMLRLSMSPPILFLYVHREVESIQPCPLISARKYEAKVWRVDFPNNISSRLECNSPEHKLDLLPSYKPECF